MEIWVDDGTGFKRVATLAQIGGSLVIDGLVALLVLQARNDCGSQCTIEVRSTASGLTLWKISP